jgi:DNA polymerase I-like protein with 3'-5' exonuclease and polymerase domains
MPGILERAAQTPPRPRQHVTCEVELGPHRYLFQEWTPDRGRVFDGFFAIDTESTKFDDENPQIVPSLVIASACNAQQGVFLDRKSLPAFFEIHAGSAMIAHNAPFDLKVMQLVLGRRLDLYEWVEQGRVWDTQVLRRLLALAAEGHTARGQSLLARCVRDFLGLDLPKDDEDADGNQIRTSFGRYLGRPLSDLPAESLAYAARDPVATWFLFWVLHDQIKKVLRDSTNVWGYVHQDWLKSAIKRFGPLTHHIQLRAAILGDVLRMNGIGIDSERRAERLAQVETVKMEYKERLRRRGYLVGQKGSNKALQSILAQFQREHPRIELKRTESGAKYATGEEDLAELAALDPFFQDLVTYRAAEKLVSTYLSKMDRPRLHPRFAYLLATGRMSCGGGFNLQNLPRESDVSDAARTIRGCFVPSRGHVFVDADYSQIELVAFAYAVQHQFGWPSKLAEAINAGQDVHRMIAAMLLGKPAEEITQAERQGIKPVSFGRPGGMGAETLQQTARASYGIELTLDEVGQRIEAYHRACPELDRFLSDEINSAEVLARMLNLTPAAYCGATGRYQDCSRPEVHMPQAWLGFMLLKTLREEVPWTRGQGGNRRPYSREELDFFWQAAQRLPIRLKPNLRTKLMNRQADRRLGRAVSNWAGRRPVFTLTGRLRAAAAFCAARNTVFQSVAADGAILGMWRVWRAGYRIVSFIHDQVVAEVPEDDPLEDGKEEIAGLMRQGMLEVVPGMRVQVDAKVTRSLNKAEKVTPVEGSAPALSASPACGERAA